MELDELKQQIIESLDEVVPVAQFRKNVAHYYAKASQEEGHVIGITLYGRLKSVLISVDDYARLIELRTEFDRFMENAIDDAARKVEERLMFEGGMTLDGFTDEELGLK